jgi:ketosteroid isomerase-like protein
VTTHRHTDLAALKERVIDAWNRQDIESVVACYTEDCLYLDPNTRGPVEGREALGRYLTKLFARWTMRWTVKEHHPFDRAGESRGGAYLWRAELTPAGTDTPPKVIHGMDLVLLRGDLIWRNEVYFDRGALFV